MKQVVCDVDDVLANLVPEWLRLYNIDFQENLKKEDILDWDISRFLKNKKNKKYLYEYIENPSLYDNILPIQDSQWGISQIKNLGYKVIFVTSTTLGQFNRKFKWLQQYGFIDSRDEYFEATNKSFFRGEYMIDDKFYNVVNFPEKAILYDAPWNKKEVWDLKASNWQDVIKIISLNERKNFE